MGRDMYYVGNDCVTQYWVHNEELNCIAGGHVPNDNDELAEQLKARARERQSKSV